MKKTVIKAAVISVLSYQFIFLGTAAALDLGPTPSGSSGSQGSQGGNGSSVEVTNLPIQILTKKVRNEDREIPHVRVLDADNDTREMAKDISLAMEETYESQPMDVREYREVTFYVVPDQVLMGHDTPAMYQLDAYFTINPGTEKIQKMGEPGKSENSGGWQEFGSMRSGEKEDETLPGFVKLTTGKTSTRVLSTKVYGPYVHVLLKNFSLDTKKRFKIIAYLTR